MPGNMTLRTVFLMPLLLATACSTVDVSSQKAPQARLDQYRTYAWAPAPKDVQPGPSNNAILDQQIKTALDSQLQKIGLTKVEPEMNPDFMVVYYAKTETRLSSSNGGVSMGFGFGSPGWVGYSTPVGGISEYKEGTLIVDFIHPGTKENFWRGTASGTVDEPSRNQEKIQVAAQKLAAQFENDRNKEEKA